VLQINVINPQGALSPFGPLLTGHPFFMSGLAVVLFSFMTKLANS